MSEDNGEKKERFGRYLILDHLVDGGMAKICRARFLGEQADKIVAIKMVQPQFSKDESFKTMFMDEIKVTFGLLHPNIVQTYDYGIHNEQLFVAMEYCDGRNLKEYLDKLKKRKFVFPVEISVYIISQVCQGLNYAHTLTDKLTGKDLNMVHRDISPHNIMLTYDGAVKVIDFGIAKSETNSEATQAGTIKGKLSYLAPEYLDGLELDPRYDEFAVGITLWEMLCSRKLFKASNDLAVLKKIQECKVPAPSSINPNVPKELDDIVLKSLSKDRNKRYENLDQMNRALMKFLYSNYPDFNATDLSYFAKELFKEEIKKDREKLFEYGKIELRPYLDDLKAEQSGGGGAPAASSSDDAPKARKENVLDFGFEEEENQTPSAKRRARRAKAVDVDKMAEDEAAADGPLQMEKTTRAKIPDEMQESKQGTRTRARTKAKGKTTAGTKVRKKASTRTSTRQFKAPPKKNNSKLIAGVAAIAVLAIVGMKFMGGGEAPVEEVAVQDNATEVANNENRQPSSEPQVEEVPMGSLRLKNVDRYKQKAFVNGENVEIGILGEISIPMDQEVTIRIEKPGHHHYVTKFSYVQGERNVLNVESMPGTSFGYLKTGRNCAVGKLYFELYGEKRVESVPITGRLGIAFPTEKDENGNSISKEYDNVFFERNNENIRRKIKFVISPDASFDLCDVI